MNRRSFVAVCGMAVFGACAPGGRPAAITNLDASATQLRADFNAHDGDVRLILLVSPT
jgi:hypothetical protein